MSSRNWPREGPEPGLRRDQFRATSTPQLDIPPRRSDARRQDRVTRYTRRAEVSEGHFRHDRHSVLDVEIPWRVRRKVSIANVVWYFVSRVQERPYVRENSIFSFRREIEFLRRDLIKSWFAENKSTTIKLQTAKYWYAIIVFYFNFIHGELRVLFWWYLFTRL